MKISISNMKINQIALGVLGLAAVSCTQPAETAASTEVKTEVDSVSYALGVNIGNSFVQQDFTDVNVDVMADAMHKVLKGDSVWMENQEAQMMLQAFFQKKQEEVNQQKYASNIQEGEAFLAENGAREEVVTTASGLQYEVIEEGTGAAPVATDVVKVHYHGTLLNGTVFDSSVDRGEPAEFPLNRVIPGWTEGLQLMTVGSKYNFYIPYQIAYGERGSGQIEPFSALVFEVELLEIIK